MTNHRELIAKAAAAYYEWYESDSEEAHEDSLSFEFVRDIASDLIAALEEAEETIAALAALAVTRSTYP